MLPGNWATVAREANFALKFGCRTADPAIAPSHCAKSLRQLTSRVIAPNSLRQMQLQGADPGCNIEPDLALDRQWLQGDRMV